MLWLVCFQLHRQPNLGPFAPRCWLSGVGGAMLDVCTRQGLLAEQGEAYRRGKWFQVKFIFSGSRIMGFVDGEKEFEIDDHTFSEGAIGFYSWGNSGVQFRNIRFKIK